MKQNKYLGDSRSNLRAKRRKTNLILNSLIAIVLLLIIFVSFSIFFSDGENTNGEIQNVENNSEENSSTSEEQTEKQETNTEDTEESDTATNSENEEEIVEEETSSDDETNTEEVTMTEPNSEDVITEGGSDPNVKTTITNPDWQPVGTTQTGEHVAVYDGNSTDWQEMLQAISYGTGLEQNNMTVWFLGNNGQNQSIGTISSKDQSVFYRVFLEWVDGQGWKPIKIEELYESDRS